MKRISALVLFSLLFATSTLIAQTLTSGTITGTVSDQSGAAIASATVVVTNVDTGLQRTVKTDSQGNYAVPSLGVGTYKITISSAGFKQFTANNVAIDVATTRRVDAQLQAGGATEVVNVEATTVPIQTDSAQIGEVVTAEQAEQLPLNGSNFVELTLIQPGVSRSNNFSTSNKGLIGGVDFSVNGNPVTNNLFLIDGANNNDVGSNRTILTYPSIDSIAEFKMLRNSYGPEYGQASGAIITIATKGGTNQFHGSVNYYGRNDAVAAQDYFAKIHNAGVEAAGGSLPHNGKDELRRNDIIYSIGGPIKKDKIFFFFSNEYNREIQGYTRASCVPTAANDVGDFSAGTTCGATLPTIPAADQAAGNPLKIAKPSPAGLLLMQNYPTPNTVASAATQGNNWFLSTPSPLNFDEENARVDFNVTHTQLLTFRYTQDHWHNNSPNLASNGYLWGDDIFPAVEGNWSQPSKSAVAKLTSTLSSTLVNEAQFSYSGNSIITTTGGTNSGLASQIDAATPFTWPASGKLPGTIPTFWGGINSGSSPYAAGQNLWSIAPYGNNMDLYTIRDDLSKVHGNHNFKAGAYLSWNAKNEDQYGGQDNFVIGGLGQGWGHSIATNNSVADMLVPDQAFSVTEQNVNPTDFGRWRDYEFYVGDNWKVKPNLTIEYGFRWSFLREPYDSNNAVGVFNPALYSSATAMVPGPGGTLQPNVCDGVVVVPGTSFCQAAAKTTGIAYTNGTPSPYGPPLTPNNNHDIAPRLGISWDPFGKGTTAIRAGVGQFYQRERVSLQVGLSNSAPFVLTTVSNRTLDALPAANQITYGGSGTNSKIPTTNTPNSWQWNLAVEHELHKDTALEVAYIGNKGIHLTDILDQNVVAPGPNRVQAAFQSNGALNALRPFPIFGNIYAGDRTGWSNYHALQALFRMRANWVNLQAAYTWSHSITDIDLGASNGLGGNASNITDPYNTSLDKGNSPINRPNMFVANAVFYLPKLSGSSGLVRNVAGGWEFSTITTLEDGNSITVYASGVGNSVQNLFGTGYSGNNRPLIVPGQSCTSGSSGDQVLNPAAFTLNGYAIGTTNNPLIEPRGYCHAPSLETVDLALYKTFKLTERINLQFRLDGFNAFNHTNFRGDQINAEWAGNATSSCGATACSPTNNIITSSKLNTSSTFGRATGDVGPRQIQYGLRLTF